MRWVFIIFISISILLTVAFANDVQATNYCGGKEGDNSEADLFVNLWNRSKDISIALDRALQEPELADHIDPEKVGVIGHSLGGYTALVLAGAKPDVGKLDKLCSSFRGWLQESSALPRLGSWQLGGRANFLIFRIFRTLA